MSPDDLWRQDALTLGRILDEGAVTSSELVEMYLDRCDRLQPILNAFAFLDPQGARASAAQATNRRREGKRLGLLDGVPISIKDNLFVAGMPAAWGSLLFKDHRPERDDIFVERLRAAGAVILGKTTTPEFALLGRTQNRLTGVSRNPWDTSLTPGGSSGGAVAAVATGMAPLAIGTDSGGSTRMPASYTGLVGLRPSNGRIPRRYGFPPMALDFQAIGLIARSVSEVELMLSLVGGEDRRDPLSIGLPPLEPADRKLHIGWFIGVDGAIVDAEVERAHRQAVDLLADLGHIVEECDPPFDIRELRSIWGTLTSVGAARVAQPFGRWRTDATDQIVQVVEQGLDISAVEYARVFDRLQEFRAQTSEKCGAFDALITPTSASPAWKADLEHPATIGGEPGSSVTQSMFCGWVNAVGCAALNVPGLPHPDGRPIGVQIVAPSKNDAIVLQIGKQLETHLPWNDRWPPIC